MLNTEVRRERPSPVRLYARNVRLAGLVLSRFPSLPWDAREDAYGAALVGLWRACGAFDRAAGFTFSTFAVRCIRNAVLNHLETRGRQEQIPVVSLETPLGEDGEGDLADVLEDGGAEKPGAALLDRAGFDALLAGLPHRQQEVLRAVYEQERPLSDVAEALGVTKQRAGQLHLQALATIRRKQSGALKSGALKSGALKSGALKSGALKSGALKSGALKSGAFDSV